MKKNILIILSFLSLTTLSNLALAKENVISVVDVDKVINQSLVGKDLINKTNDKRKQYTEEIIKQENNLKKERDSLQKKQAVLSSESFSKEQKSFEDKVIKFQTEVNDKKLKLEKAYSSAMKEIDITAREITKNLAKEKGFFIVIPTNAALYHEENIDITNDIISKLDKKLTKANFKVE